MAGPAGQGAAHESGIRPLEDRVLYNLVLLDQDGKHLATEPLEAEDHSKAQSAAGIVLGVCRDVANTYELRFNGAVIAYGHRKRGLVDLNSLLEVPQTNVLDLVERLEHGLSAVALSHRLRRTTARLRRRGTKGRHSDVGLPVPTHTGRKEYWFATRRGGTTEFHHCRGSDLV
jgi:hypothetical protein